MAIIEKHLDNNLEHLSDYLEAQLAPSSSNRYLREITLFLFQLKRKSIFPQKVTHTQITQYLGSIRSTGKDARCALHAIQKYFDYLIENDLRSDNPARCIRLKDRKSSSIQLQDLFKESELERLLTRPERYPILRTRNQLIISLLIYQALTTGELQRLTVEDMNLTQETVYIESSCKQHSRTLKLNPNQVIWLRSYIEQDRNALLKTQTNTLLINKMGYAETGEGITYLIKTLKPLFTDRVLNPQTIRQSVITNLLKQGKDLRLVQVFAGHKYPSSTERYQQTQVASLKYQILQRHPLG